MRDLIILVADGTMEVVFRSFFERGRWQNTVGCGAVDIWPREDVFHDPLKTDGGVHCSAHEILRPYLKTHHRAMVVLDQQFGGERPAVEVQSDILQNLQRNGWDERCAVVVIDPELEVWLWQDNPHVSEAVGLGSDSVRQHLLGLGLWPEGHPKPVDPKGAFQVLCRNRRDLQAKVVYARIARAVAIKGCLDPAFNQLVQTLRTWFPPEAP